MLEQENNQEVLNTNEEAVVTQIEMEGTENSIENSIEPTEITEVEAVEEILLEEEPINSELSNELEAIETNDSSESTTHETSEEPKEETILPEVNAVEPVEEIKSETEIAAEIHHD